MSENPPGSPGLRVAFVAGVRPDKWARIWARRMPRTPLELVPVDDADQVAVLYDGRADMSLVRLPVDSETLHVIPLYREVAVVVAPAGHFVEAADEVTLDDLGDELVHAVPPLTARLAVETVAAGTGVVLLPLSLARLHHRKDVVHRPVVDLPEHPVGLAWPRDGDSELCQTFVGVVRGRTETSSRGPAGEAAPKRSPTDRRRGPRTRRR